MVRYKHRYFVATVAASPEQMADLGAKEIFAMLKVNREMPPLCTGGTFNIALLLILL